MLLQSCKKNASVEQVPKSAMFQIQNGHLAFLNSNSYERFLSLSIADKKIELLKLENYGEFESFKDKQAQTSNVSSRVINGCSVPDSLIGDNPDFFSTLDADGVVQIGRMVYRYDYCNDKVFVISASDALNQTYYNSFMQGVEIQNVVGAFPTYVDVVDAVDSGYKTMPDTNAVRGNETFERVGGFLGNVHLENFNVTNNPKDEKEVNQFDGKLAYDKFGIYFHFYGKEKYQTPCFFGFCTSYYGPRDWSINYQYNYKRKRSSTIISGSGTLNPPVSGENKVDYDFYSGSRGLKKDQGYARWDVMNVYTKTARIERNQGSGWSTVTNYGLLLFSYVTNYYNPGQPDNYLQLPF